MVSSPEENVFRLAKQGNLQAIAIFLNQQLAGKESQIKLLKPQESCLQMLLKAPKNKALEPLIEILHQQLLSLRPESFNMVRIYRPQPGTKTAHLIHKFVFSEEPEIAHETPQSSYRYSIGEILAQVHCMEDLQRLKNHPFVTNTCPQCGEAFSSQQALPVYWDCLSCGWQDDLNHWAPALEGDPASHQHSIKANIDNKTLGRYLVEADLVTEAQIQVVLADQGSIGLRLGEALVNRGWINETTLQYLIQKVVLPERAGYLNPSNLRLSRKLVKNLLTSEASPAPLLNKSQNPPSQSPQLNPLQENQSSDAPQSPQKLGIPPKDPEREGLATAPKLEPPGAAQAMETVLNSDAKETPSPQQYLDTSIAHRLEIPIESPRTDYSDRHASSGDSDHRTRIGRPHHRTRTVVASCKSSPRNSTGYSRDRSSTR